MIVLLALAAMTPVAGSYDAQGSCPGQAAYRGTVSLVGAGPVYAYTEVVANDTFHGTAIERDGVIAVSFSAPSFTGVINARRSDTGWDGLWSATDGAVACRETWTRR